MLVSCWARGKQQLHCEFYLAYCSLEEFADVMLHALTATARLFFNQRLLDCMLDTGSHDQDICHRV